MNLPDALRTAQEIDLTEGLELLAVGRFRTRDEIRADSNQQWGISIHRDGQPKPETIWHRAEWDRIEAEMLSSRRRAATPAKPTAPRPQAAQPTLF